MLELHVTEKHTGKMTNMASISTSCKVNPMCAKYAKIEGSVCSKCYAQRQLSMYKNMQPCMERNFKILTENILSLDELPTLNNVYFRIESFGDLANKTQAINYLNLIKKNPQTFFGWWTKNPQFIKQALDDGYEKPKNCNIIYSSMFINERADKIYNFIDKIFTVYDKDHADKKKSKINCGARSCFKCHKCYEKNRILYINEKLK